MNAQLRANRPEVTDRFPMLGYTIRTDGTPQRAELAFVTDPELLLPQNKGRRTRANFFASRSQGPLRVPRGEAVYLVPPEVMLRFVGQAKLYAALALTPERAGAATRVEVMPDTASPYVSLRGLSGRSLRRVRLLPTRSGYGGEGADELAWVGDGLLTGSTSVAPAQPPAGSVAPTPEASPAPYDDGFGPLPVAQAPAAPSATTPAPTARPMPGSAAQAPLAQAQEIIQPFYDPADPSSALVCQNDAFSLAREEWFAGVPNTTLFPHSAICLLEMKDASGTVVSRGTGFYVGPQRILTAGHNLHGKASVDIIPANHDRSEPYGRCNVAAGSWRVSNRYPADSSRYDLAVIDNVPLAAPNGRWFDFLRATPSQQMQVVVCGYSSRSDLVPDLTAAINGRLQHLHAGYVASVDEQTFDYPILTLHRASGAPVYHLSQDAQGQWQALVAGVHVSGEPAARGLNRGCFLTPEKLDWIEGRTTTLARAMEIPLDPGAGGQSIDVSALQPADIIVSTARHAVSYAIRGGTLSAVSHVMLYVGDGRIVEAVGSGVREVDVQAALTGAILAVAYRVPNLDASTAAAVVAHARSRVGDPYNYAGVAFSGYRILNPLTGRAIDRLAGYFGWEVGQAGAAYCSELVLEAFERAGRPLTATSANASTPDDVAQIGRRMLNYVGHLVASDEVLGIPLALNAPRSRALDTASMSVAGERTPVTAPPSRRLSGWQLTALEAALTVFSGPLAPLLLAARAGARAAGVSIGIGPAVGAGLGAGGALGAGLVFLPDGGLGVYGAAEIDIGFIASISATVQVTVVRGGIESFSGWGLAAAISGGEGVVVGAAALFDLQANFQGVSFQVGVGAGLSPVDFYIGIQRQVATPLSLARSAGRSLTVGRALETTVGAERSSATPPSVTRLSATQRAAVEAALAVLAGPLAPMLVAARAAATAAGVSIGFGPAVGAGLGAGGTLGVGLIFGRDGELGAYGSAELDVGFISSISATVQVTVVRGGIDAFNGWSLAAALSGGEGVVGGAAALFDLNGGFQGVSFQVGVGAGLSPVDFYIGVQRQVAAQLSLSLARTLGSEDAPPITGVSKRTDSGGSGGASWTLEQSDGLRLPAQGRADGPAGQRRVALDDWPYLDTAQGPLRLPLSLSWRYQAGGLGDVRIQAGTPQVPAGCTVSVSAILNDGAELPQLLSTRVLLRHVLASPGRPEVVGTTQLTLFGDGTYERQDRWEAPAALAA